MLEVRWHARGGQGAKTAALLLADTFMNSGFFVQAFPEYGPERTGAPIQAFNRIDKQPINVHCHVTKPDVVIVLDPTLLGKVDVTYGLPDDGTILVNTPESPVELREKLKVTKYKIFTVDAYRIAKETIGVEIPNAPLIGAFIKATKLVNLEDSLRILEQKLKEKFIHKLHLVSKNIEAIKRGYNELVSLQFFFVSRVGY